MKLSQLKSSTTAIDDHTTTQTQNQSPESKQFIKLLEGTRAPLARFCRALCRSATDHNRQTIDRSSANGREERAKDLMSETILKAFEHFESLRDHQAFLSYLLTIAVRTHRAECKRQKRWQPFSKHALETMEASQSAAPDANADIERLYDALSKLPEKMREAIVLSEIMGLKLEEVAVIQRASLSAVKSRVSRGRKLLQSILCEPSRPLKQPTDLESDPPPVRQFDTASSVGKNQRTIQARFTFESWEKL